MKEPKHLVEPYLKENNLLQLSLFNFGRRSVQKTFIEWEDESGSYSLKCVSDEGVPGSREQDCYTACMRIWVKKGMPEGKIEVSYSDVARELGAKTPKNVVGKIKQSLKKLGAARYQFVQCFIKADKNGNNKVTTQFSLFDSTSLFENEKGVSKKGSISVLVFPDIIKENLEAKYYQYLDMAWYRSLPEGLSRRLYEYLTKRRYHKKNGSIFTIGEKSLCRWLPINDQHSTNRRRRLNEIAQPLVDKGYLSSYHFDSNKKQCIFAYAEGARPPIDILEIPETSSNNEQTVAGNNKHDLEVVDKQLAFVEALDWISTIPYFQKKKRQEIASLSMDLVANLYSGIRKNYEESLAQGKHLRPNWIYQQFMGSGTVKENKKAKEPVNENLKELFSLIKIDNLSEKLKREIKKSYDGNGYDYVKWNIFYANKNAKKKYSTYLQRALQENWGEEWVEDGKIEIQKISKVQEEERQKIEAEKREEEEKQYAKGLQPVLLKKLNGIDTAIKLGLWEKAEAIIPTDQVGRFMNVKIEYSGLILEYFNTNGEKFPKNIVSDLKFIKKVASDIGK